MAQFELIGDRIDFEKLVHFYRRYRRRSVALVIRERQGFSSKIFCFVIDRCGWFEAASYLAAPAMTISTVLSLPHDPNESVRIRMRSSLSRAYPAREQFSGCL
jgi:hypothetical protein